MTGGPKSILLLKGPDLRYIWAAVAASCNAQRCKARVTIGVGVAIGIGVGLFIRKTRLNRF
jgi:hypothetical protein